MTTHADSHAFADLAALSGCGARSERPSLRRVMDVARQRRDLAGLSDAQLRDIGLTRADAVREAGRAPWDLPTGQ